MNFIDSARTVRRFVAKLGSRVGGRSQPACSPASPATVDELLDADYRKKLARLNARITIDVQEPFRKTRFKLVGAACDQSVFIRIVHRGGQWEPAVTKYIVERLEPGDIFIDIGANIGYFTALAARLVGAGGCVHSFEASSHSCRLLMETLSANSLGEEMVKVHRIAAWSERVDLDFRISAGAAGGNHVVRDERYGSATERVEGHALSEYLENSPLDRLKLIKMDIEGAEIEALLGLRALLSEHPAEIICEVNTHCLEFLNHTLLDFWETCQQLGMDVFRIEGMEPPRLLGEFDDLVRAYPSDPGVHLDVLLRPRDACSQK